MKHAGCVTGGVCQGWGNAGCVFSTDLQRDANENAAGVDVHAYAHAHVHVHA